MRAFIASAPDELLSLSSEAAAELSARGFDLQARRENGAGSIDRALSAIDHSDVVVALVGWRGGPVPPPEAGGDGLRPWVAHEIAVQRPSPKRTKPAQK